MWVPAKAVNPGLVYDIAATDYVDFLCAINYGPMQIAALTKKRASDVCVTNRTYAVGGLNYPSFSVKFSTDRQRHGQTHPHADQRRPAQDVQGGDR
jgi:hypothetical protein